MAAPPIADVKTPPHFNQLTDGRNRGRTELVTRKDGTTFYRTPKKPKPPKDSKVRKVAFAYRNARAAGLSTQEIADAMGLKPTTVQSYVKIAARKGWFDKDAFADPSERLEEIISHQVVDNIEKVLTEKEQITIKETGETIDTDRLSDRAVKMTNDVAHGIGLLKTHQVSKTEGSTNVGVALKVDVVMPPSNAVLTIRPGSAGGTPAFDAEIIETPNPENA
jgi:predicted transcriptional regulator